MSPITETVALQVVNLASLPVEERHARLSSEAEQAQASLNLENGPLMRAILFRYGDQEAGRLLLVIHHLAVDGISWRILLEDLQTAYGQRSRGESIQLPPKTTSFRDWAHWLAKEGVQQVAAEQVWWQEIVQQTAGVLPADFSAAPKQTPLNQRTRWFVCSRQPKHKHCRNAHSAYHTQIDNLLLTALVQTICH